MFVVYILTSFKTQKLSIFITFNIWHLPQTAPKCLPAIPGRWSFKEKAFRQALGIPLVGCFLLPFAAQASLAAGDCLASARQPPDESLIGLPR